MFGFDLVARGWHYNILGFDRSVRQVGRSVDRVGVVRSFVNGGNNDDGNANVNVNGAVNDINGVGNSVDNVRCGCGCQPWNAAEMVCKS